MIAFLAQRLISPAENENDPSYSDFLAQVEEAPDTIARVRLDPRDTSVEVVQRNGADYETGYPPRTEEVLVNTLRRQRIELIVEEGGGGSLLSLVTYLLPFLLFFAFWLFLMNRMERRRDRGPPPTGGWQPAGLRAVVDADSADLAAKRVRTALPADGAYRLGEPRRWVEPATGTHWPATSEGFGWL